MLSGPRGGVCWLMSKGLRASIFPNPLAENDAQDTPALSPVVPTHTSLPNIEAATVLGKVPGIAIGWPTVVKHVGSEDEMDSMDKVFDPALTAKMCCVMLGICYSSMSVQTSVEKDCLHYQL